jgi:ATP-binding cassette subfamily B protein RaxB
MELVRQSEAAECGIACLAMLASAHGLMLDLPDLRRRFDISGRGATLAALISQASSLGFVTRPVKLDMDHLPELKTPCVLHWDFNHFVVLERVRSGHAVIVDPAVGRRRMPIREVAAHFTGVALELRSSADFRPKDERKRVDIRTLTGRLTGLPARLAQIVLVALALEFFALTAPFFSQLIVDDAIAAHDLDLVVVVAVGFALLLVTQTALSIARGWLLTLLGRDVKLQWASNVFTHLLQLPASFFERRHLGDVVSRFGAVDAIQKTLTGNAIEAIIDGAMAIAALFLMFLYSVRLALVVMVAVLLYALLRWLAYGALRNASAERLILSAREQSHFLETIRAIVPIKLFGRGHERAARWQNLAVEVQNRDLRTARLSMLFTSASQLLTGSENLLVYGLAAQQIISSNSASTEVFTVGMLFAFVSYKTQFSQRVTTLINYAIDIRMLGLQAERLGDIVLSAPETDKVPEHSLDHLPARIEFKGVSFRYGSGEPWIVKSLDLTIEAGQNVAIVGPSGCGKTTVIKLMLGLLAPSDGEILYGGAPIHQLGIHNYRRLVGAVMQEDVLLSGSIAENVSFFDLHHDQRRVEEVCEAVGIHADIAKMPMGYRTLVGDLGSTLSGGQKQRVILARALYKNPKVIVLDEATSHLDVLSERRVVETLNQLRITRIVIAHRPETIAGCEHVIQMPQGQAMVLAAQRPIAIAASSQTA